MVGEDAWQARDYMTSFADRCGIHDIHRENALSQTSRLIDAAGLVLVRFAWCDVHGITSGQTLVANKKKKGNNFFSEPECSKEVIPVKNGVK